MAKFIVRFGEGVCPHLNRKAHMFRDLRREGKPTICPGARTWVKSFDDGVAAERYLASLPLVKENGDWARIERLVI